MSVADIRPIKKTAGNVPHVQALRYISCRFLCSSHCLNEKKRSTRRDSNPRPSPWQGDAPPLSHSCISFSGLMKFNVPSKPHIEIHLLTVSSTTSTFWISPRPISNSQLRTLLHFHLCPIYLVVFKGSYFFRMGYLILRGASRLDAFSVYPVQTWLPGRELSSSTGTPAVRPPRSSRTKGSSSQISSAYAG